MQRLDNRRAWQCTPLHALEDAVPLPEPEPQSPAAETHPAPESAPESDESKSGPRKRGWWQRVLS